jgi:hypothetical protein
MEWFEAEQTGRVARKEPDELIDRIISQYGRKGIWIGQILIAWGKWSRRKTGRRVGIDFEVTARQIA